MHSDCNKKAFDRLEWYSDVTTHLLLVSMLVTNMVTNTSMLPVRHTDEQLVEPANNATKHHLKTVSCSCMCERN